MANSAITAGTIAGGNDLVLITSTTASAAATVDFTGLDSTYHAYLLVMDAVVPATDGQGFNFRVETAGTTWHSSSGNYSYSSFVTAGGYALGKSDSATLIDCCNSGVNVGTNTGESMSGHVWLYDPSEASLYTTLRWETAFLSNATALETSFGAGTYRATTAVTGLRFFFDSGNVESGNFRLYGLKDA